MPRYIVTLTDDEIQELHRLIQRGGKGYRIKHAQTLLKLDRKPYNVDWTYDSLRPVVCIDETNKQLIKETRIPCGPGNPEKLDSVYIRNGVADVFMISEPLAGKRETVVTKTRNAIDLAQILKYTADVLYPRAEKIILVTDNLNIHTTASLYKAFAPDEVRRLAERFEMA